MTEMRLQKWIAQLGLASRREAEKWIEEKRVLVNGEIPELGSKVDPDKDEIVIDGKRLSQSAPPRVYWLLNKPDQVLTSRNDEFQRATIYDLPALRAMPFLVSPVGRLDFRTEGLLLLTNDGEMSRRLMHPKYEVPRHYHVLISGKMSDAEEEKIRRGMILEDGPTGKVEIMFSNHTEMGGSRGSWYHVSVKEGRNRLVRRIFEALEHKVVRLVRFGYGDLRLPQDLAPGEYRQLSSQEIIDLKRGVEL